MKGANIQHILLAAALLWALWYGLANASEIKDLKIEAGATGTRAELHLDDMGEYHVMSLHNPERLVVDFPASRLGRGLKLPAPAGVVRAVRHGQPQPGMVRLVFDLNAETAALQPRVEQDAGGPRLILEWPGDGPAVAVPVADAAAMSVAPEAPAQPVAVHPDPIAEFAGKPVPAVSPPQASASVPVAMDGGKPEPVVQPSQAAPAPQREMQAGVRPLVVAIDPGHGGQDPGAHGPNGTREKDVTLAIARELARQVNATPGLKAYLTRDSDVFIPLPQRARRASENKADIFLSIHADAAENRSARGSSVYVLSLRGASSQRARWLADKENAADVIGGGHVHMTDNTLASVLLDLTQSGNMKASEDAAGRVLSGLKRVGNNHKPEIERANFAVLRTSDKMPAMLVETAFISNPDEERRLVDRDFQRSLAGAILDGIHDYFSRQPPPGTLYAARAQVTQTAQSVQGGTTTARGAGGSP